MSEGTISVVVDGVAYKAVVPDIAVVTLEQANGALRTAGVPSCIRFISPEEAAQRDFEWGLARWIDRLKRLEQKMLARAMRLDRRYLRRRAGDLADPKRRRRSWAR